MHETEIWSKKAFAMVNIYGNYEKRSIPKLGLDSETRIPVLGFRNQETRIPKPANLDSETSQFGFRNLLSGIPKLGLLDSKTRKS